MEVPSIAVEDDSNPLDSVSTAPSTTGDNVTNSVVSHSPKIDVSIYKNGLPRKLCRRSLIIVNTIHLSTVIHVFMYFVCYAFKAGQPMPGANCVISIRGLFSGFFQDSKENDGSPGLESADARRAAPNETPEEKVVRKAREKQACPCFAPSGRFDAVFFSRALLIGTQSDTETALIMIRPRGYDEGGEVDRRQLFDPTPVGIEPWVPPW